MADYYIVFDDRRGNGYRFPADKDGNPLDMPEQMIDNYYECLDHPERFRRFNKLIKKEDKKMAKVMIELSADEVRKLIPYSLICETRYGAAWSSGRRKRAWQSSFTADEKSSATRLFSQSYKWTCGKGVPDKVKMTAGTLALWQKLGEFCATMGW